ncbi:MAG: hypothetical protein IH851_10775 [Armatimonadetes bacterium]|nr:hypothetical protein [Armatimonadota bacterium]
MKGSTRTAWVMILVGYAGMLVLGVEMGSKLPYDGFSLNIIYVGLIACCVVVFASTLAVPKELQKEFDRTSIYLRYSSCIFVYAVPMWVNGLRSGDFLEPALISGGGVIGMLLYVQLMRYLRLE